MAKTPQDILRQINDEGIELIDLKFADVHGKWQHLTVHKDLVEDCLLYTSPSPRDGLLSRMPSSA